MTITVTWVAEGISFSGPVGTGAELLATMKGFAQLVGTFGAPDQVAFA